MLLNQRWKEWEYATPFRTSRCTFVIRGTDWKCKPSLLLAAFTGGVLARVVQRVWRTMNLQYAACLGVLTSLTISPRPTMIEEQASRARGRREAKGPNEPQPIDGPGGGDNAESASGGAETPVDNPRVGTRQRRNGAAKRKKSRALRRAVERPPEIDSESQVDSSASGHSFWSALEEPLSDQGLESKVQALVSEALEEKLEIQLARLAEMLSGTSAGVARSASDEAQPTVVSRVSGPKADVRPARALGLGCLCLLFDPFLVSVALAEARLALTEVCPIMGPGLASPYGSIHFWPRR